MGSTTLKRFDEEGRLKEDLPLLHWAMQTTLHDIETAIDDFLANFPNRAIVAVLRVMVIPFADVLVSLQTRQNMLLHKCFKRLQLHVAV